MATYKKPSSKIWSGRTSAQQLYLHEKVQCLPITKIEKQTQKSFAVLGYACDEGVKRNQGRIGAKDGPYHIRKALGKMPNHLPNEMALLDFGDVVCADGDMEAAQQQLTDHTAKLLASGTFPILLGGGHDIAYGHYNGIKKYLISEKRRPSIGIINFDAHFDLRDDINGANSGTPFYQIANENDPFHYLCLGIRKDANDRMLFQTAHELDTKFLERETFRMQFVDEINKWIIAFLKGVDQVYVTIDLDGFSSAFAPGVSAASPMGYSQDIVLESLKTILASEKLISLDIAEMNPRYDVDGRTAKLAASIMHYLIHNM
ncbi:formimidoylglutamase [Allomuricauda sp. SCSIO 65647]|uniref:formimidoylglutamase n=1 Tax=Allomuricauda sp. SCSIO 65647 TaxID=2908843 RepID=UPI001F34A6CE|nr:formimidoylglutamase [Muricauda sp. SCSIO 65647]UJH68540.1 formimidoylglutamase [Muricauda sp. SCSIO 65647]